MQRRPERQAPSPGRHEMRLRVNPVACDAFGYCAELIPELITLDEWGYPVVDEDPVPAHLRGLALRALRDCPRRALLLDTSAARGSPR